MADVSTTEVLSVAPAYGAHTVSIGDYLWMMAAAIAAVP